MRASHWLMQPRFYLLLLVALLFSALIGAAAGLFWVVLYAGIDFVWETIPAALGFEHIQAWYILLICTAGGALVGLCQRYLGDHPKEMKEELREFRAHKRFDTAHIPQGMITSFISLSAGASLGPEAPLFGLSGGLSSLAADQLRRLSGSTAGKPSELWTPRIHRVLLIAGIAVGLFAFVRVAIAGGVLGEGGFFDASLYEFSWDHLFWALPASVIGIFAGYLFLNLHRMLRRWAAAYQHVPFWRGLVGGAIFGIAAALFPLILFSGQHSLHDIQVHGLDMAWTTLLLSGLLKLLIVPVLLNSGWKGGTFLPLMTSSAILAMLISFVVPGLPPLVPMTAAMAAIAAITLGNPIIALLTMVTLAPISTIGMTLVAIALSLLVTRTAARLEKSAVVPKSA